MFSILITDHSL